MSLRGVWTKMPGRPPAPRPVEVPRPPTDRLGPLVEPFLASRPGRRRDNVALLYSLALEGVADHLGDGLVGVDGDDLNFSQVLGTWRGPEDVQLVPDDEAVIRAD